MDKKNGPETGEGAPRVSFHFIKSNFFRVIRVDGGHGGVNPRGEVQIALYSERLPIPTKLTHRLSPQGQLEEPPIETQSRDGFVREVEVEALMHPATARSLGQWLIQRADEAEKAVKEQQRKAGQ